MKKLFLMLMLCGTIAVAQEKKVVVKVDDDDDTPAPFIAQEMMTEDDNADMSPMEHGMMMQHLKLTDDQEKQVGKLHDELEKKQIELSSKMQSMRVDLRGLFRDEKPDQGKIESMISGISKLQTEMKLAHVGFWFSVNKLLTPEQQQKWKHHAMMMGTGQMRGRTPMPMMMKHRMKSMKDHEEKEDDD